MPLVQKHTPPGNHGEKICAIRGGRWTLTGDRCRDGGTYGSAVADASTALDMRAWERAWVAPESLPRASCLVIVGGTLERFAEELFDEGILAGRVRGQIGWELQSELHLQPGILRGRFRMRAQVIAK